MIDVKAKIRDIPDFPKPGILFRDITPAIGDPQALSAMVDWFAEALREFRPDFIVGLESRGFIFAPAVAVKLGAGFVPVRKPGKLPARTVKVSYDLEYGSDAFEIHADAFKAKPGAKAKVAVVDDLLATGGTAAAACGLVEKIGGTVVASAFAIELEALNGRAKLPRGLPIFAMMGY